MMSQHNLPGTSPRKEEKVEDMTFSLPQPEPIKGFPELRWTGKRPFTSTHYYPAQLKERYGDPVDGWMNRIYWGDNLQVMSHLLKEFRGKVDLIYIDPPFASDVNYKMTISLKGISKKVKFDAENNIFQEAQYTDIWANDNFIQFIYERIILLRELLSQSGVIFVHCDYRAAGYLKLILDEVFGVKFFRNELIWHYSNKYGSNSATFDSFHNTIFFYSKSKDFFYSPCIIPVKNPRTQPVRKWNKELGINEWLKDENGNYLYQESSEKEVGDVWEIPVINPMAHERTGYPTQKPELLLERVISCASRPGALVFDCFMGSGTTQAVAMKLGRRFIGADINLGAIQTTTKRLNGIIAEKKQAQHSLLDDGSKPYLNFEVYNVNNYNVFRNPVQARELLIQALEIDPLESTDVFDGMKDGYKVKIMPVNRIATRADLNPLLNGINYQELDRQMEASPGSPAERIMLVCMGHEPDLAASLKMDIGSQYRVEVKVVDILRDRKDLTFKYDSEADIAVENGELVIRQFYPRNLLQKLSILDENVEDWRQLVETVAIDWNYNGDVLQPAVYDSPEKNGLVQGQYPVPQDYGIIRVKITDLLSESLEMTLEVE